MQRCNYNNLTFYRFETFAPYARLVNHAVFTRHGGFSQGPYASLNVGLLVGDAEDAVEANLNAVASVFGASAQQIATTHQVHGSSVHVVEAADALSGYETKADGLVTAVPNVPLLMRFADCVPVLLVDPVVQAVGIAHAGWRGTLADAAGQVVRTMSTRFGSRPANMIAGIGPSVGPQRYQIGDDVAAQVRAFYGEAAKSLLTEQSQHLYFNLWAANRLNLERAGLSHIETAGICTAANTQDYFSHRAEKGQTGRFAAVIMLQAAA